MSILRHLCKPLFGLLYCAVLASPANTVAQSFVKSVVSTEQVRAELMVHAPQGLHGQQDVWVGLQLSHQPEWHTYWKNAGDSGLPTSLEWTLPPGVTIGDTAWPTPHKISIGNLVNYGYEGKVLLPAPLQIDPSFRANSLSNELLVKLKAFWLVCRKECIPQEGEFSLKVPLNSSTALNASEFAEALTARPQILPQPAKLEVTGQSLQLSVYGLPAAERGKKLELFPETPEIIASAGSWSQGWNGDVWTAQVPLTPQRSQSPDSIQWVLVGDKGSYRAQASVSGRWPAELNPQEQRASQTAGYPAAAPAKPSDVGFMAALFGALLGGLILNLMPCVFPILAIKVMGFAKHGEDAKAHRISGIAYTTGVVLSFLALGALMVGLRSAGEQLGWGFQLQSPAVIAGLAMLFTALGLNLAGMFEFGQMLPTRLASFEARNPSVNAFLSGILAVAIASPCTAPFMGASLGFAVAMPASQAFAVFAALGLGMALPYLLASLIPSSVRLLPRPGAWMDTFRKFMAFPMLATVVWLVWVLGQQSGIDGAASLLAILLAGAAALWAVNLSSPMNRVAGSLAIAVLAITVWVMAPQMLKISDEPRSADSLEGWQAWEPGKVEQSIAANRPVFVDFTAAWCVTCQYNKKTTLSNLGVLSDLKSKNVALLRADWTKRDPAISAALSSLGRNGVPVYVFYQQGKAPIVLSEVLGVDEIRATIARL